MEKIIEIPIWLAMMWTLGTLTSIALLIGCCVMKWETDSEIEKLNKRIEKLEEKNAKR